jgi:hypothetical protein
MDFDLDGALSPVDAVRVVNRVGYELNPAIIEESVVYTKFARSLTINVGFCSARQGLTFDH